ncbi:S-protein homolog 29 [Fagus crenata]
MAFYGINDLFLVYLVLPLCLIRYSTAFIGQGDRFTVIHVFNALPSNSMPISLSCNSKGISVNVNMLQAHEEYVWTMEREVLMSCVAQWDDKSIAFKTSEPSNTGYDESFWSVLLDGIYRSWDGKKWIGLAVWGTKNKP